VGEDPSSETGALQKTMLPLNKDDECMKTFADRINPPKFSPKTMICAAGGAASTTGACNGDSGGPLLQKQNNESILIGVASWVGGEDCKVTMPSVFARVSAARGWINLKTGI